MGGFHHGRSANFLHGQQQKEEHDRLTLLQRAQEAIEYLIECDGHTALTKTEFANALAARYGFKNWTKTDGAPDRRLVEDVCNLTRDQDDNPVARQLLCGMVVAYAPNVGGMVLFDLSGDMPLDHALHFISGEMQRQQAAKTINRRRIAVFKAAATQAMAQRRFELGRILSQCENEVDTRGFVSDTLYGEYLKIVIGRDRTK